MCVCGTGLFLFTADMRAALLLHTLKFVSFFTTAGSEEAFCLDN